MFVISHSLSICCCGREDCGLDNSCFNQIHLGKHLSCLLLVYEGFLREDSFKPLLYREGKWLQGREIEQDDVIRWFISGVSCGFYFWHSGRQSSTHCNLNSSKLRKHKFHNTCRSWKCTANTTHYRWALQIQKCFQRTVAFCDSWNHWSCICVSFIGVTCVCDVLKLLCQL